MQTLALRIKTLHWGGVVVPNGQELCEKLVFRAAQGSVFDVYL